MALDPGPKKPAKKKYKRKTGASYSGADAKNKRKRGSGGKTMGTVGFGGLHPSKTEGFGPVYTEDFGQTGLSKGAKKSNRANAKKAKPAPKKSVYKQKTANKRKKSKSNRGWQLL